MTKRLLPVLALLALIPVAIQAQSAEERIDAAKARAQTAGIPEALLDSKIEEGRAKGVPMDRIVIAVERRAAALANAQAVMASGGKDLTDADLAAGADALDSGVSEAVLSSISETAPRERRAVAITALTELVALGHVPEDALQRVIEALDRGPEALVNLPAQAAEARDRRGPPGGVGPAGGVHTGAPAAVPAPGQRPGSGRPEGTGRPNGI